MSKLCLSSTSKTHFSTLHISDFFFFFCSFILSQPLCFSYFIFFSPYLLKLFFFLSPIVISASLLLLAPITVSKKSSCSVAERLRSKIDKQNEEFLRVEDFEVFEIVFENPIIDYDKGNQVEALDTEVKDDASQASKYPVLADFSQQYPTSAGNVELENFAESKSNPGMIEEEKRLDGFLRELDEFENVKATGNMEKKKVEPQGMEANKAVEKKGEKSLMVNGSKAAPGNKIQSWPSLDYNLGGYGSMRKEKDWKSTLACKLIEERNSADNAGERMDLLWETYENETEERKNKASNSKSNKKKNKKKYYEIKYTDVKGVNVWNGKDEEEDESDGQLCCLRTLKFSAGKMISGMGKPNLVKISKTIKGIGWLHNLSRHSKKVHNGDRFC